MFSLPPSFSNGSLRFPNMQVQWAITHISKKRNLEQANLLYRQFSGKYPSGWDAALILLSYWDKWEAGEWPRVILLGSPPLLHTLVEILRGDSSQDGSNLALSLQSDCTLSRHALVSLQSTPCLLWTSRPQGWVQGTDFSFQTFGFWVQDFCLLG